MYRPTTSAAFLPTSRRAGLNLSRMLSTFIKPIVICGRMATCLEGMPEPSKSVVGGWWPSMCASRACIGRRRRRTDYLPTQYEYLTHPQYYYTSQGHMWRLRPVPRGSACSCRTTLYGKTKYPNQIGRVSYATCVVGEPHCVEDGSDTVSHIANLAGNGGVNAKSNTT